MSVYSHNHGALDELSFSVERGEVVGLLRPNSVGESTALRLTTGLPKPASGRVKVPGMGISQSLADVRRFIGFMSWESRNHHA